MSRAQDGEEAVMWGKNILEGRTGTHGSMLGCLRSSKEASVGGATEKGSLIKFTIYNNLNIMG